MLVLQKELFWGKKVDCGLKETAGPRFPGAACFPWTSQDGSTQRFKY